MTNILSLSIMQYSDRFRVLLFSVLAGVVLLLSGCDSTGTSQNQPPTAEVTVRSSSVNVGSQVLLDGSSSSDPNEDSLHFNWSLRTPSNSSASLSDASAEQPTFTPDILGDYTATLEVSDGTATTSDEVTVTAQSSTVELTSGFTSDRTLSADTTYVVTNVVAVRSDATLTIEPGTQIEFENDAALRIDNGSLIADGTSSNPISMTATEGNEQQGWWRGITVYTSNPNNILNHVEVRHGGSGTTSGINHAANVALGNDAALNLTNSTIADGGNYGVYVDDSEASLESFSNNSFSGNASAPIWIPFTNIGVIDANTSFDEGTTVRVYRAGLTSGNVTINALSGDTPYRFSSTPKVTGASVTVEPGVEMTFESDVAFWVDSEFVADGTSSDPITFTATEGNGQQGWWRGIAVYSSNANNTLNHVEIRHGGSTNANAINNAANIGLEHDAVLTLTNAVITDSDGDGVYCNASDANLNASGNSYSNNAGENVANCS